MSDLAPIPPASRQLSLTSVAIIAAATFVVGLLLAGLVAWRMQPAQPAPQPTPAAQPPARIVVAPPVATDPASLAARQEILAAQLAALEQRTATVTGVAANSYGNAARAEGLLVAFAARRAIDRGGRLDYLADQLKARFGASNPAEVATVLDAGNHPIVLEDLRLGLDQIGPQLALGPAGDGWAGAFVRMLGSLVVIHPQNTPSPVPGERLARIRRMIDKGQVEAAVEEIKRLPGAGQAKSWLDGAERYIAVRRALDTLEMVALTGRAAAPAPTKP